MSFVLDALKRSEQDRNQEQMPELLQQGALMHAGKAKPARWPYILIAVLVLNALVFLFIHFQTGKERADVPVTGTQNEKRMSDDAAIHARPSLQPSPKAIAPANDLAEVSELADANESAQASELALPATTETVSSGIVTPAPVATAEEQVWAEKQAAAKLLIAQALAARSSNDSRSVETATTAGSNSLPSSFSSSAGSQEGEIIHPKQGPSGTDNMPSHFSPDSQHYLAEPAGVTSSGSQVSSESDAEQYQDVPFLYEMTVGSRPKVPHLKFNSHIYSDSASARRVMINNIYLSEGQSLSGIEVVYIGERDIVFRKQSTLFKLPAMRDWNG